MKKIYFAFLFSLLFLSLSAQKEWSNWYFNGKTLLTFKNGVAKVEHNFINPVPPANDFYHFYNWGNGGISYSDPTTGDLKFIISNRLGFGSDFKDFPNENFIRGCEGDYSYHIIPFHNNANKFYVVQFQDYLADLLQQEFGTVLVRCPNAIGLGYSIVDLSLNGGKGSFSVTDKVISGPHTGQMTTVKHANGKDVWVIVHPYSTAQFHSYLFTDDGIDSAVISEEGPMITGKSANVIGTLTASHDGKMLAGYSAVANAIQLFDFDKATGKITNYRTLPYQGSGVSKIQFSPDNSKLYYLYFDGIYQYDLNQVNVAGSLTKIFGYEGNSGLIYDMQLAPDGKIYVTKLYSFINEEYKEYTGIIECPNLPQYACNFNPYAMELLSVAFQDLINDFVNDPKAAPITKFSLGKDTAVCFGNYTISAPPGWESYKWNTGETTQQITVTKPGVYYVLTGNTGFSCPEGYGYITITDKAIKLDLGKDTILCYGQTYQIHIDDDYTNITWQNGSHVRDSLITSTNKYIITANDKNGCITGDTISISYKNVIADFGPDTTLCNNNSIPLQLIPYKAFTLPPGATYLWQDGSINDNFTVTKPGKYWGKVTYDGCTSSDTINVSYINVQNVYLGKDTTLCDGDSLLLQSNIANAKYYWNTGDTTSSIYVKKSGSFSLKVSSSLCSLSDTIKVTFNSRPNYTLGVDTSICEKEKLILAPNIIGGNFYWQDSSTHNTFTITKPGLYWVKVTQNNCSISDSINVTYKSLPPIDLGKDTGICNGETLLLKANSPETAFYLWQDGNTSAQYLVQTQGIYSVKVTGSNSCINNDTIQISFNSKPQFSLGSDTALCDTKTISYNFNLSNAIYEWNNGSTQNNFTINSPGIYSLKITQNGCSSIDSISVKYKPLPKINIGNDTTLCNDNSVRLNAFYTNANYLWQDNSTANFYDVTKAGLYYVAVNLNGCSSSDSIIVKYNSSPSFSLGNDTLICMSEYLILKPNVQGSVNYLWQDGSTQPQFVVKDAGLYRLLVQNECGAKSDEIEISTFQCVLNMPTAFTPNKDGLNDVFRVKYPFPVKEFTMTIYDRWGQKIYSSLDIKKGWDGNFKGNLSPVGSYVWTISLTDLNGNKQSVKGNVLLIR